MFQPQNNIFLVLAGFVVYAVIAEWRVMSAKAKSSVLKEKVDEQSADSKDASLSDSQLDAKLAKDLGRKSSDS